MQIPIEPLSSVKSLSIFSLMWKYKAIILFILFTLPVIINSINLGIQEKNYIRPVLEIGQNIVDADHSIYQDVQTLKSNPQEILGIKPEHGIYRSIVYYLHILFFIWLTLGKILFISIPFLVFYYISRAINNSSQAKNIILSALFSLAFIFLVNSIILSYSLATGDVSLTLDNPNKFLNYLEIIKLSMPFHGIVSLVSYLINIII